MGIFQNLHCYVKNIIDNCKFSIRKKYHSCTKRSTRKHHSSKNEQCSTFFFAFLKCGSYMYMYEKINDMLSFSRYFWNNLVNSIKGMVYIIPILCFTKIIFSFLFLCILSIVLFRRRKPSSGITKKIKLI